MRELDRCDQCLVRWWRVQMRWPERMHMQLCLHCLIDLWSELPECQNITYRDWARMVPLASVAELRQLVGIFSTWELGQ